MASKVTFKGSLVVIDGKVDYGRGNKWVIDGVPLSRDEVLQKYGQSPEQPKESKPITKVNKQKFINKPLLTQDKPLTKVNYHKLNVGRRKGFVMPESSKQVIRKKLKGQNSKGIYLVNGKPFTSSIDAAKEAQTTPTTIRSWCKNNLNNCSFKPAEKKQQPI